MANPSKILYEYMSNDNYDPADNNKHMSGGPLTLY
jgi:hypothetical protein